MSDASFSTQTIEVPNPLVAFARAQLATGVIFVLVAGWGLFGAYPYMSRALQTGQVWSPSGGALLLFGAACVTWIAQGIYYVANGIRLMAPWLIVPTRTPADFPGIDPVEHVLVDQEFRALRLPKNTIVQWIQRFFRERVLYFTPRETCLLEQGLAWIRLAALLVLGGVALAVLLPRDFVGLLSGTLGRGVWIVLAVVVAAAVRGIAIPMLIPKGSPTANRHENVRTIRGGGDPGSLLPMFDQEFLKLREGDITNRSRRELTTSQGTVADTGEYRARMYVETQPLPEPPGETPLAWVYLGAGIIVSVVGVVVAALGLLARTVPALSSNTLIALAWTFVGHGLLESGRVYLSRLRYRSTIAYLKAEGTIGRSEIKAGKGLNDSFESANLVVRSDSTLRLYVASIRSETYAVEGPRFIVQSDRDAKAEHAMATANQAVDAYERAGIVVRPMETSDDGLRQLAQANLAFRQAAATLSGEAPLASLPAGPETSPSRFQLPTVTPAVGSATAGDTMACPMCAETIKAAARKCRFCGHLFEG